MTVLTAIAADEVPNDNWKRELPIWALEVLDEDPWIGKLWRQIYLISFSTDTFGDYDPCIQIKLKNGEYAADYPFNYIYIFRSDFNLIVKRRKQEKR